MLATVEFTDGYICQLELIYNWDRMHMYRSEDAYLLVPYKDVVKGVVEMEDFLQAQKDAKHSVEIGAPDLGKALYSTKAVEVPCKFNWKEVKDSSS